MTDQPPAEPPKAPSSHYNLPGNSHKAKDGSKKNVQKVITGEVTQRKKPLGRRIAETFAGDDAHSVGHYVLFEVALPAIKQLLADAASQGVERLLFGERGGGRSTGRSYTPYNRVNPGAPARPANAPASPKSISRSGYEDILYETRAQAEVVLDQLTALIEQYDVATVSDLYSLVGVTGSFTDDKWGWTTLAGARTRRVQEGFLLDLPRAIDIS